jgi:hypothetical protein
LQLAQQDSSGQQQAFVRNGLGTSWGEVSGVVPLEPTYPGAGSYSALQPYAYWVSWYSAPSGGGEQPEESETSLLEQPWSAALRDHANVGTTLRAALDDEEA